MAKLLPKPRFRLECGHLSYAVVKVVLDAFPDSDVWCNQCAKWRKGPVKGTPLW